MSMMASDDQWTGENDPLDDEPVEPVAEVPETEPVEPQETESTETDQALDEGQTEPQVTDPTLSPEEETYRKRYDDLRREQVRFAQERNAAQQQLAELQTQVRQYLEFQDQQARQAQAPQAQQAPEPSDRELEDMGFTSREQYRALAQRAAAEFAPQIQGLTQQQQQLAQQLAAAQEQNQQAMTQAQYEQARTQVLAEMNAWRAQNPEYSAGSPAEQQLVELIQDWNMAWTGDPTGATDGSLELSADTLSIAAEALKRPVLAEVLRFNPSLIDSDQGMTLARDQATAVEAIRGVATQPAPTGVNTAAVDAKLAAAQTLPASGGNPPGKQNAKRDEFDDVVDEWQNDAGKGFFARR